MPCYFLKTLVEYCDLEACAVDGVRCKEINKASNKLKSAIPWKLLKLQIVKRLKWKISNYTYILAQFSFQGVFQEFFVLNLDEDDYKRRFGWQIC